MGGGSVCLFSLIHHVGILPVITIRDIAEILMLSTPRKSPQSSDPSLFLFGITPSWSSSSSSSLVACLPLSLSSWILTVSCLFLLTLFLCSFLCFLPLLLGDSLLHQCKYFSSPPTSNFLFYLTFYRCFPFLSLVSAHSSFFCCIVLSVYKEIIHFIVKTAALGFPLVILH